MMDHHLRTLTLQCWNWAVATEAWSQARAEGRRQCGSEEFERARATLIAEGFEPPS